MLLTCPPQVLAGENLRKWGRFHLGWLSAQLGHSAKLAAAYQDLRNTEHQELGDRENWYTNVSLDKLSAGGLRSNDYKRNKRVRQEAGRQ